MCFNLQSQAKLWFCIGSLHFGIPHRACCFFLEDGVSTDLGYLEITIFKVSWMCSPK